MTNPDTAVFDAHIWAWIYREKKNNAEMDQFLATAVLQQITSGNG